QGGGNHGLVPHQEPKLAGRPAFAGGHTDQKVPASLILRKPRTGASTEAAG
ncbi:hypothetical protein DBR06_SOUSAS26510007, partial [Sousa chinensis]